jgi:hypothetical protein
MVASTPRRHPDLIGDIAELAVLKRLVQLDYDVYLPYGKNHRCDFLVLNDDRVLRVQCKSGRLTRGGSAVMFNTASSYNHTARQPGYRPYRGQADYFGVYCEAIDRVYWVPVDEAPLRQATLRLRPTANRQSRFVRWAKDYELKT